MYINYYPLPKTVEKKLVFAIIVTAREMNFQ